MSARTCRGGCTPRDASGRATFCHTRRTASPQVRPLDLRPGVGRSRFLQTDPIEGGSANDYDYAMGDPVNGLDLEGRLTKGMGSGRGWRDLFRNQGIPRKHWYRGATSGARSPSRDLVHRVGRWVGDHNWNLAGGQRSAAKACMRRRG